MKFHTVFLLNLLFASSVSSFVTTKIATTTTPRLVVGVRSNQPIVHPVWLSEQGSNNNDNFGGGTAVLEKIETVNGDIQQQKQQQQQQQVVAVDKKEFDNIEKKDDEELSETQKLMQKVKDAGTAGIISYALWELGFWAISIPVVIVGYKAATGHFPDLSNNDDLTKLGAEAFAFVNFARFAVPLRIGLALSTTPWIQENIVDKLFSKNQEEQ